MRFFIGIILSLLLSVSHAQDIYFENTTIKSKPSILVLNAGEISENFEQTKILDLRVYQIIDGEEKLFSSAILYSNGDSIPINFFKEYKPFEYIGFEARTYKKNFDIRYTPISENMANIQIAFSNSKNGIYKRFDINVPNGEYRSEFEAGGERYSIYSHYE